MAAVNTIKNILKKRIIVLDGATGTELHKKGMPSGVSPELWVLDNPEVIQSIHSDYFKAGADIVTTCTFGANRFKLAEYKRKDVIEINKRLAKLAKASVPKRCFVAGDIGPSGHFIKPFGSIEFEEAVTAFKEQVKGLLQGGVDLFVIETMMDIQEARAALIAVKELTDLFTIVTMTYEENGRTLNGTDPVTALITLQSLGADAVGCNCSAGPESILKYIQSMSPYATVPLVAKPNAGMPKLVNGKTRFDMGDKEFASFGKEFASSGVGLIGGCCGTTPAHIRSLKKSVRSRKPKSTSKKALSALSSSKSFTVLEQQKPLVILGERINPTGKKVFQEELKNGRTALMREFAKEQEKKGASLLDVNVGVPGIDESKALKDAVNLLSVISPLPLVLDSSKPEAIEAALRIYPGRALINSISGEKKKQKKLLALAAKYGAMFILLPLTDTSIPEKAENRIRIIRNIYNEARKFGLTKNDFIIDCLVMAASSNPYAPQETLKTVQWCSKTFSAKTVIGLSNVSFGLPARKWINCAFLAQAVSKGLTAAIANPSSEELMNMAFASDVLQARDPHANRYIRMASALPLKKQKEKNTKSQSMEEKIHNAVLEGNREDITRFISDALASGKNAETIVNDIMIPAITQVGDMYDKKEYFLPQLIAGAEAMKKGFLYIEPYLKENRSGGKKRRHTVLLATVKGDIHDIGKNIVSLMLKNHGFEVIDLGKDVTASDIIKKIKQHDPYLVGLSALMTTTMVNMKDVIDLAKKEGLACRFVLGGAVVTKNFAESVGAEYAKDGVAAVRIAEKLK